jgi:hypothetical protein
MKNKKIVEFYEKTLFLKFENIHEIINMRNHFFILKRIKEYLIIHKLTESKKQPVKFKVGGYVSNENQNTFIPTGEEVIKKSDLQRKFNHV